MSEFHLTHIALVGARMSCFHGYGYYTRNELSFQRIAPAINSQKVAMLSRQELMSRLRKQLPLWIHNIIVDRDFPERHKLSMPIRRFEGEMNDSKHDEVVSAVLSHGFKNETFDPLNLPHSMPMRQRCAMVVHIKAWQNAYKRLENDVVTILADNADAVATWCEYAQHPGHALID